MKGRTERTLLQWTNRIKSSGDNVISQDSPGLGDCGDTESKVERWVLLDNQGCNFNNGAANGLSWESGGEWGNGERRKQERGQRAQSSLFQTRLAWDQDRQSRGRDAAVDGNKDRAAGNSSNVWNRQAFLRDVAVGSLTLLTFMT